MQLQGPEFLRHRGLRVVSERDTLVSGGGDTFLTGYEAVGLKVSDGGGVASLLRAGCLPIGIRTHHAPTTFNSYVKLRMVIHGDNGLLCTEKPRCRPTVYHRP